MPNDPIATVLGHARVSPGQGSGAVQAAIGGEDVLRAAQTVEAASGTPLCPPQAASQGPARTEALFADLVFA